MKFLILLALLLPGFSQASYQNFQTLNSQPLTYSTSEDLIATINCPTDWVINSITFGLDKIGTGTTNIDVYFNSVLQHSGLSITSSSNYDPIITTGLNVPCSDVPLLVLDNTTETSFILQHSDPWAFDLSTTPTVSAVVDGGTYISTFIEFTIPDPTPGTGSTTIEYVFVDSILASSSCSVVGSSTECIYFYSTSTIAELGTTTTNIVGIEEFKGVILAGFIGLMMMLGLLLARRKE